MKCIICRPFDGLCDVLSRIYACIEYCEKYDCIMCIDTMTSRGYDFHHYFEFINQNDKIINYSDISSNLDDYHIIEVDKFIHIDNSDHNNISYHHDRGGDHEYALELLKIVKLTKETREFVKSKLKILPEHYDSLHVRNTDILSDWESAFKNISKDVDGRNLLVCSDHQYILDVSDAYFDKSVVYHTTENASVDGRPIHNRRYIRNDEIQSQLLSAIVDLLALGMSDKMHCPIIEYNPKTSHRSGFNHLAEDLTKNKWIVKQLLDR
jgi:hypothetical protein